MRESAQAALSWVRSHSIALGVHDSWFEDNDIHIHVPAGAVPKDGPSAGITIATALVSLVTGRPVSDDVAMTGEITLTGQVLPIGGVKEKMLAAQRAGIGTVILPKENEPDLEELPTDVRKKMQFRSRRVRSTRSSRLRSTAPADGDRHERRRGGPQAAGPTTAAPRTGARLR